MEDRTKNKGCASSPSSDSNTLNNLIAPALYNIGFEPATIGGYPNAVPFDNYFALFIRKRPVGEVTGRTNANKEEKQQKSSCEDSVPYAENGITVGDFSNKIPNSDSEKPRIYAESEMGSESLMGGHNSSLTPPGSKKVCKRKSKTDEIAAIIDANSGDNLPVLADFSNYKSLVDVRTDTPTLCIGYDSEWLNIHYPDGINGREMMSWQFSAVFDGFVWEFLFLARSEQVLDLGVALGVIYDNLQFYKPIDSRKVTRYLYCTDFRDGRPVTFKTSDESCAISNSKYIYVPNLVGNGKKPLPPNLRFVPKRISDMPDRNEKRKDRAWGYFHQYYDFSSFGAIPTAVICHAGKVDLSGLKTRYLVIDDIDGHKTEIFDYVLKHATEVQGGLVSLQNMPYTVRSLKYAASHKKYLYPVSLSLRDTMCHAPVGKKSLADLGEIVGVRKVDLPVSDKKDMRSLLSRDPALYANYAAQDAVVTLLYSAALYGYNRAFPATATSAGAHVARGIISDYFGCKDRKEFEMVYRGLHTVGKGLVTRLDCPGYLNATSKEPINDKANTVQYYASQAYHGGYNGCSEVGWYPEWSYDYDLRNAYPTSMCMVGDVDWENPIRATIVNRPLTLQDWLVSGNVFNPLIPMLAYVSFEFPEDVSFPCIPVNVDGIPVYPRTSKGANNGHGDFVYACGPELYLAVKLGAKVFCETGYILNTMVHTDGFNFTESKSHSVAVRQLVSDRSQAKEEHGKGSLEELFLKMLVNAEYGKVAQNVIEKSKWSALSDDMQELGESVITNPVAACLITSIVRAELLAVENQIVKAGYMVFSVTTDGLISTIPESVLKSLDMYGLRPWMEQARKFLTGGRDPEIWEEKHKQDDLVNFTTRGNVSLRCSDRDGFDGVCAHNSARSPYPNDTYEDRKWLMTQVLSRVGSVNWTCQKWMGFKDIVHGEDFQTMDAVHHIRMDFDCKRKPVRENIHDVHPVIEGQTYTIANFTTKPYEDIAEFKLYRAKRDLCTLAKNKGKQTVASCLRTKKDWDAFYCKLDTNACGAHVSDLEWSKLISVVMGYRAGYWDIQALHEGTITEKCAFINRHNKSNKLFTATDWKNARRPERQKNILPEKFTADLLKELQEDNADSHRAKRLSSRTSRPQ